MLCFVVQQSGEGNSSSSRCPATIPMLLQGVLETLLAGPITGATRRGCEHLSEELLTPKTLRSRPARPHFPSPSPGPSVTERTAVNTQHGFNKAYNLRNQCGECQLLPKGGKYKSGSGYAIYGWVLFNVVLYIECFITHLICVRIIFLSLSCFHAFESCSNKQQNLFLFFSSFFFAR